MAVTWRDEVREVLAAIPTDKFDLQTVYSHAARLHDRHPNNGSIEDTIRRVLQELRDLGELEFLGRGVYRRPGPRAVQIGLDAVSTTDIRNELGAADSVPLEDRKSTIAAQVERVSYSAIAREHALVNALRAALTARGHEVARWRIRTPGGSLLFTDIYDTTERVLYEAKAWSDRDSVRMAVGQLLDYRRYVDAAFLAVLLPDRPPSDMISLLEELGIGLVFPGSPGSPLA
ncbi:hypothetical protein ACWKWN_07500 [Microbacterium trichothecenolyticum]